MKKILLASFLFVLLFQSKVFAQQTIPPIFDSSKPALRTTIVPNIEGTRIIQLPPFTSIYVPQDAFDGITSAIIYQSDFDSAKSILPSNQYPVSTYYLTFFDSSGNPVNPKDILNVSSTRTYAGSNMFFNVIYKNHPTQLSVAKYPNIVSGNLTTNYNAFVISTDHPLTKNDPSLTSVNNQASSSNLPAFNFQSNLTGLILAIIALIIIGGVLGILLFVRVKRK